MDIQLKTIIHVVTGFIVGLLNVFNPMVALQGVLLFLWYELLEQMREGDMSYIDTLEFALGWGVGTLIAILA